jgi:hypothetical protein
MLRGVMEPGMLGRADENGRSSLAICGEAEDVNEREAGRAGYMSERDATWFRSHSGHRAPSRCLWKAHPHTPRASDMKRRTKRLGVAWEHGSMGE